MGAPDDVAFAKAAYEWVRDQVTHSVGAQNPRVTVTAAKVLAAPTGLCYGKSHLLAALLRAEGITTGLCYQRLMVGGFGEKYRCALTAQPLSYPPRPPTPCQASLDLKL